MAKCNEDMPCTKCGTPSKRIMSSLAGLIFIGPGFYETDYKKKT
jgi:predicted nucleic acid-binding Zn ribbon protein